MSESNFYIVLSCCKVSCSVSVQINVLTLVYLKKKSDCLPCFRNQQPSLGCRTGAEGVVRWRGWKLKYLMCQNYHRHVSEILLMCVRNIIDMCQKYYWCESEISLMMCVRNSIDVCRKYYWCVMEILLMCVWNIIDKYYSM